MPSTNAGTGPLTNNPMIEWDGSYEVCIADTGVTTCKVGLLVYRTASAAANAVTPLVAASSLGIAVEKNEIGIIVGPPSHPSFPKIYDYNNTAFAATTESFWVHWIKVGDKMWLVSAAINGVYDSYLIPAAVGTVALSAAATTADRFNVPAFRCKLATTSKSAQIGQYIGLIAIDTN